MDVFAWFRRIFKNTNSCEMVTQIQTFLIQANPQQAPEKWPAHSNTKRWGATGQEPKSQVCAQINVDLQHKQQQICLWLLPYPLRIGSGYEVQGSKNQWCGSLTELRVAGPTLQSAGEPLDRSQNSKCVPLVREQVVCLQRGWEAPTLVFCCLLQLRAPGPKQFRWPLLQPFI